MTESLKPRIAVIFPGALGDFICLLPALHRLAERARIEIFAKAEFADITDFRLLTLERYEINRLFVSGAGAESRVREIFAPYDTIYSWMASAEPVFAAGLSAAARGAVRLFAFHGRIPEMHQADYYRACLGLSDYAGTVNIPLRKEAIVWAGEFWHKHGLSAKPVLVLGPGSGAREKNWPAAYFSAIGRWWRKRVLGDVIVLCGPVETERGGLAGLTDEFIPACNLSLAQIAAILSRGYLYLGNDSGISHLAGAVGLPTVALFGPSDARRWAPRGARATVLSLGVDCSPCAVEVMKRCPHRKCLTGFSPAAIVDQLEKLGAVAILTRGRAGTRVHCGIRPELHKKFGS